MMSAIIYSKDKCTSINVRYIVFFAVFFPNNCYNMYNVNVIAGYVLCNIHMRSLLELWLLKKVLWLNHLFFMKYLYFFIFIYSYCLAGYMMVTNITRNIHKLRFCNRKMYMFSCRMYKNTWYLYIYYIYTIYLCQFCPKYWE